MGSPSCTASARTHRTACHLQYKFGSSTACKREPVETDNTPVINRRFVLDCHAFGAMADLVHFVNSRFVEANPPSGSSGIYGSSFASVLDKYLGMQMWYNAYSTTSVCTQTGTRSTPLALAYSAPCVALPVSLSPVLSLSPLLSAIALCRLFQTHNTRTRACPRASASLR